MNTGVDEGLDVLEDLKTSGESPRELTHNQIKLLKAVFEDPDIGHYLMAKEIFGYRDIANKGCPGQGNYEYLVEHFAYRNPHVDAPLPTCGTCGQTIGLNHATT